ncbi:MAG: tetratricopeptide repeat protein [Bacteroidetes bacterium]|nr:tetratricopeptide repeat protein [Bacteroidota bacterium]
MRTLFTLLMTCSSICCFAQEAEKVKELEQRVKVLEAQVAKLQTSLDERKSASDTRKKMATIAGRHVMEERQKFKAEDIEKAEELYGRASKIYAQSGKDSKKLLDSVVTLYPQLNRAGCAQLYRAQLESGQEKERLLKDCISRFGSCYYLDGAQVRPLAIFQLASYYRNAGNKESAQKLFDQLRKEYPDAVGHDGGLLVDEID